MRLSGCFEGDFVAQHTEVSKPFGKKLSRSFVSLRRRPPFRVDPKCKSEPPVTPWW